MATGGFAGAGDDQDRLLDEATAVVKEQAFYMKRAMDNDSLREALKHASNLICELRTSLLSPKNYYELYMQVFQEMQHLSAFFSDKSRHGRKMIDLYESVQHAGNILPRLYLLATVGASYIKSKEAPAKEILLDMNELIKGVQHPIRGLFLRYYLSQMVKDKLPDTGTEYEAEGGGNIEDAFEFILTNFMESNRLWVRIQNQGPMKDKAKREKERHDLRVLVGANLVRLSQLEGMTVEYYADTALPRILEHVLSVKDTMSQQYLFESMIQVFPDEFHIRTLEQELAAYPKAQPTVDMKPIMVALMKRLSEFLKDAENQGTQHALTGVDIFALFRTHLQAILERCLEPGAAQGAPVMPDIGPALELQSAFLEFTLQLYPENLAYVDIILQSTVNVLEKFFQRTGDDKKKLSSPNADKVVDLLTYPLTRSAFPLTDILEMENYSNLLSFLNFQTRKEVALNMVKSVTDAEGASNGCLTSVQAVQSLFSFITPLIKDEDDTPADETKENNDAFINDQQTVCKLIHAIQTDDIDTEFQMLTAMRSAFGTGGPKRMMHSIPGIAYSALGLTSKIRENKRQALELGDEAPPPPEVTVKKVFQFVHKTTSALTEHAPETALQLWLAAAVSADKLDADSPGTFEPICYEFLTQGLLTFEENISESIKQYQAIFSLVGTLSSLTCLEEENFDNICSKIVQHSARLLKKPMQCRAIAASAHLFWCNARRDGKRVLECLQKCLKITDAVVQSSPKEVRLWVEMLDMYVYYMEAGCDVVEAKYIESLRNLCTEHIDFAKNNDDSKEAAAAAQTHLNHTVRYIKTMKSKGSAEEKAAFADLNLDDAGNTPI